MEFFARNIRPVIILLGFVSSLTGTLGSFLFVEGMNGRLAALSDRKNAAAREIERLGKLSADYFMANQQGDLIVFASVGSFLLLVANLFEHRTKEKAA
jgi:hypothetical protein